MKMNVLVVNGPNLNLLGEREPEIYGRVTLAQIEAMCRQAAGTQAIEFRQTNSETQLIDWIHEAIDQASGIVINPGLGFVLLFVGLEVVRGVLGAMTRRPEAHILSLQNDLRIVGNHLFGITDRIASVPTLYPVLVLAVVVLGCLAVLRSRVRAVEIVG